MVEVSDVLFLQTHWTCLYLICLSWLFILTNCKSPSNIHVVRIRYICSSHLKKCKYINVGPCPESPFVSRDYKGWRVFTDSLNGAKWSRNCKVNERLKRAAEPSAELKRPLFFFDVFYSIWNLWNMFSQYWWEALTVTDSMCFLFKRCLTNRRLGSNCCETQTKFVFSPSKSWQKNSTPHRTLDWDVGPRSKCWGFTLW